VGLSGITVSSLASPELTAPDLPTWLARSTAITSLIGVVRPSLIALTDVLLDADTIDHHDRIVLVTRIAHRREAYRT
jgi:hypothetical protein